MEKKMRSLLIGALAVVLLSACQAASGATSGSSNGFAGGRGSGQPPSRAQMETQIDSDPALQTRVASGQLPGGGPFGQAPGQAQATPTPTSVPAATSTPQPTPTAVPVTAGAVQTAQSYFTALEQGDFAAAAKLVSAFSLRTFKMTAGDAVADLTRQKQAGAGWSDFAVVDSRQLDDQTVLVHVTYQKAANDAKTGKALAASVDETWAFRLENRQWRFNWDNLIDTRTLGFETQTTAGLSVTPLQLARYTDCIRLTVLAQNRTNATIVIGTANQTLATFYFGSQAVDAENTRYILEPLRSDAQVLIEVQGAFESYPDSVEIVKYKNYQTAPWYTFGLVD